jgi:hypothetical protein
MWQQWLGFSQIQQMLPEFSYAFVGTEGCYLVAM